ncbi:hypothetical protein [Flavobacterium sp. DG2-3]|uniref:hypothetical protein n=1 Tax=Flavobacterium sp. DG2-3 TaxID=3068317 RepID=UPI00273D2EAF|nr:hypothetical protein [Flavobacterium sp. DG2-3]MDP5200559.1 hypothetical protein [Flavobacterium sp. DG2-3]
MNKYTAIKLSGYYRDSVRTSGEVIGEFVRDKEVICKLILFIGAKVHYFFIYKTKKLNSNIFLTFCEYTHKTKPDNYF